MAAAATVYAHASEYFHAEKQARLYNEISSFQAMRNDLVLKKMNFKSAAYGYAVVYYDSKFDKKINEKFFTRFKKENPGKRNYFVIFVGPDMRPTIMASTPCARHTAARIIEKSAYNDKVLAGPLVMNTVETMKHR